MSSRPITVANCNIVTKHVNANTLLYPGLQPDYQKSRSYFPALDNFHRKYSLPIPPYKTTFDETAAISELHLTKQQVFLLVKLLK